jgi:2-hydroxy-3-keto-5-methylthiopentenyl-1-phosphate phosphatase
MNPIIFSDFDGTITQVDVTDEILSEFAHPSWREVEQEWVRGTIGSRECLQRQMALVDASRAELNALIDAIPLDPHFREFLRWTRRERIPFYVVSDGFDYIIERVLRKSGVNGELRNGSHLYASSLAFEGRRLVASFPHPPLPCEHGCATCKEGIIRERRGHHRPVVFIGDGLSDRFAVAEADVVFAKRQLLAYCEESGVPYRPFTTFADVEKGLRHLRSTDAVPLTQDASSRARGRRSRAVVIHD